MRDVSIRVSFLVPFRYALHSQTTGLSPPTTTRMPLRPLQLDRFIMHRFMLFFFFLLPRHPKKIITDGNRISQYASLPIKKKPQPSRALGKQTISITIVLLCEKAENNNPKMKKKIVTQKIVRQRRHGGGVVDI